MQPGLGVVALLELLSTSGCVYKTVDAQLGWHSDMTVLATPVASGPCVGLSLVSVHLCDHAGKGMFGTQQAMVRK